MQVQHSSLMKGRYWLKAVDDWQLCMSVAVEADASGVCV